MPMIHFAGFAVILIILFTLFMLPCTAQSRGMHVEDELVKAPLTVGRQYCLLIAINRYREWLPLENPVRDAKALKQVLADRYLMNEFIELYNEKATKANIVSAFAGLRDKLEENDSVLIYYAGHGNYDETTGTGFWIPFEAGTDRIAQLNWISNSQIGDFIAALTANHVFLISDSCFSGGILNLVRGLEELEEFEEASQYFNKAYSLVSRQVITSGAIEDVPDKSSFSRALIAALRNNHRLLIDPYMLFSEIRLSVKETTPLIGNLKIAGHEDGASFLLFLQQEEDIRDSNPASESFGNLSFFLGTGGSIMFPMGNVKTIMNLGNRFEGIIGFKSVRTPVFFMAGITLGTFNSATNATSKYEYNIRAFSFGGIGRVGFTLGILTTFAECTIGAIAGAADYLQPYIGITDQSFIKPHFQPGLGINLYLPFSVNLNLSCGFLTVFFDNNPYMAIVPSIRIEYEN